VIGRGREWQRVERAVFVPLDLQVVQKRTPLTFGEQWSILAALCKETGGTRRGGVDLRES